MPSSEEEQWLGVALSSGSMTLTVLSESALSAGSSELGLRSEERVTCQTAQEAVEDVANRIEGHVGAMRRAGLPGQIRGVGVSIGGHVDARAGRVVLAHDLIVPGHHWEDEPFAERLAERLGFPVVLDNDVNCMAHFHLRAGRAVGRGHVAFLYISPGGHGFGSAFVCNGAVYGGAWGGAGEIGHLVVQPEGPRCRCGNRGCLQALVSGVNLVRNVNWGRPGGGITSTTEAAGLVAAGDARAQRAFASAGRFFGQGIAAVTNLINPELVVIGGAPEYVSDATAPGSSAAVFKAELEDMLATCTYSDLAANCEVVFGQMDLHVAAAGGAHLARAVSLESGRQRTR